MNERKQLYNNFLKSDWWKEIRNKRLKKDNKCFICRNNKYLQIHHTSYKKAFKSKINKAIKNTVVLCGNCHKLVHDIQKERHKSLEETYDIVHELKREQKHAIKMFIDRNNEFDSLIKNL